MKSIAIAAAAAITAGIAFADNALVSGVLDEIMPAPRCIEAKVPHAAVPAARLANPKVSRGIVPGAPAQVADQGYRIDIAADAVTVVAGGEAGERYARTTLEQIAKLSGGRPVPAAVITDWPALKWRGVMNDCGRNFLAVEGVKAIIDLAAKYKMNLFHWHVADYHGWRLESKKYPKVTAPETMTRQVGKFYSQSEFRDVIAYAKARGITVMPELDVPGHTLALRKGLGVKTMKDPIVDRAVSDLFDELCSLAPKEDMPFIHLGTDEVRVDPEYVDAEQCSRWAETVARNGRIAVRWGPGQKMHSSGEIVDMAWYDCHTTNTTHRVFDSARMYFASTGPQMILNQAAFVKPCRWNVEPGRQIGAIACSWHDDNVGDDTLRLFANTTMAPAVLLFADNYWTGCREDQPQYVKRMPPADTDSFLKVAVPMERRLIAQRDKVIKDFPYAFPYVAQTGQRWRISRPDGQVIDSDYRGGMINVMAMVTNASGEVIADTWVNSPRNQQVGAWIDFLKTGSAYSRGDNGPMPGRGEWDRNGSIVEVNGEKVAPPEWKRPGARTMAKLDADGKSYKGAVYSSDLCETPLEDEWSYIREPTKVTLKKGWNHVRIVIRKRRGVGRHWRCAFQLLEGSSAHPREVPGLEYSPEQRIGMMD